MKLNQILVALALAAPLGGCFDQPEPAPPPPESVFAARADQALVAAAMTDIAASPYARRVNQFRSLVISDDPKGGSRAVCGQASDDGARWKDFVAIAKPGPAISMIAVRRDALRGEGVETCRKLVLKYMGARVRADIVDAALVEAKCDTLDKEYWWAWKSYCRSNLTLPATTPAPAQ